MLRAEGCGCSLLKEIGLSPLCNVQEVEGGFLNQCSSLIRVILSTSPPNCLRLAVPPHLRLVIGGAAGAAAGKIVKKKRERQISNEVRNEIIGLTISSKKCLFSRLKVPF